MHVRACAGDWLQHQLLEGPAGDPVRLQVGVLRVRGHAGRLQHLHVELQHRAVQVMGRDVVRVRAHHRASGAQPSNHVIRVLSARCVSVLAFTGRVKAVRSDRALSGCSSTQRETCRVRVGPALGINVTSTLGDAMAARVCSGARECTRLLMWMTHCQARAAEC